MFSLPTLWAKPDRSFIAKTNYQERALPQMDTLGLYGLISGAAILIAVGLRFVVYTVLVKNSKWLPEKATKVANTTCVVAIAIALVLIAGNAMISGHVSH
jgi:hypothetical protein